MCLFSKPSNENKTESRTIDKDGDLTKGQKTMFNKKVKMISFAVNALEKIPKKPGRKNAVTGDQRKICDTSGHCTEKNQHEYLDESW